MNWELCLEFLKVLLSWPVATLVLGILAIFNFKVPLSKWITNVRLNYGELEISSQQNVQEPTLKEKTTIEQKETFSAPIESTTTDSVQQWRANSYLWEYRYLNLFLAHHTQLVLDWLYDLDKPIAVEIASSVWMGRIPSPKEQEAVLTALLQHYLVQQTANVEIQITPKGKEYVEQRGKIAANSQNKN
jgi:hypothetical protein